MKRFRGFTLIELLLYMAILPVILLTLVQIFDSILDTQLESRASAGIQQDATYLLTRIQYDIHRASQTVLPALPGQTTNSLTLSIGGGQYVYSLSGGNLQLQSPLGVDTLNSSDTTVSGLTFSRYGSGTAQDTITVGFTLTSGILGLNNQAPSQSYQSTFAPR